MNNKGQAFIMAKLNDAIMAMICLFIFVVFTTPLIAILSDGKIGLNNGSIFPMGGITLFFIQAFSFFMAIVFMMRILSPQSNVPQQGSLPYWQ